MGNRMGGAMRGTRNRVNAGLDRAGGWGQAMDDRFDRFSGDLRSRVGQRMASRFGGRGGRRTGWGHAAGGVGVMLEGLFVVNATYRDGRRRV